MLERASTSQVSGPSLLLQRLQTRGWEFDFFQAVWLLEHYRFERVPVGEQGPVEQEAIRFRPHILMGFPPADIRRITECREPVGGETYHLIEETFMGLYGVSTPLPLHYAIDILRAEDRVDSTSPIEQEQQTTAECPSGPLERKRSSSTRDFLDILHHRLVSLFYRSWTKYRYERTYGTPHRDRITDYLLWLIGCPRSYDEDTLGVSAVRMIRYAGILTQRPRSASTLEGVLYDYWNELPAGVEQFVGRWVPVSLADISVMGVRNSRLGVDLTVGEQVFDWSGAFNISLGPVDWETYLSFLPDGPNFSQTRSLAKLYCVDPLFFTIEVRLHAGEVPKMYLTSDDSAGRLGYTSWVRTADIPETSVVFDAQAAVADSIRGTTPENAA